MQFSVRTAAVAATLLLAFAPAALAATGARPAAPGVAKPSAKAQAAKAKAARAKAAKERAARRASATRALAAVNELVPNGDFEGGLTGWGGYQSTLSLASDGPVGARAAKVTNGGAADFSISLSAPAVRSAVAGTAYVANAYSRSATPGRTLCLRVREWAGSTVAGSAQSCVTGTSAWKKFATVSYTARASGRQLDVYVYEIGASRYDSFEVDGVSLVAAAPAASPAPVVPLPAPVGLAASNVTTSGFTLSWVASGDARVVSYRVLDETTAVGSSAAPTFAVSGLACGSSHSFSVSSADATGATSAAATVSASTAACPAPVPAPVPTPPAPAPPTLYSSSSPWNTAIPAGAAADPNSPAMVAQLAADLKGGDWPIAAREWTQAIYYSDASTPRTDVLMTAPAYSGRRLSGVPIPANAQPSPDSDATVVVIDKQTNCEYDIGGNTVRNADGTWTARFANTIYSNGDGRYPYAEAPRASGFGNAAGVITPEEMAAGQIDHALAFVMQNTKVGGPVWPATASDGWSSKAGAVPEGARVQLDPTLNLDSLGLNAWQKVVARALQRYGMYLVDTGGVLGLQAQSTVSTGKTYPWGTNAYPMLPASLVQQLRVLQLPPQFATVYKFVPTACATLK